MSDVAGATPTQSDHPEVPASAWALAGAFVVGQVLELIRRGPQAESAWPISMVLGALLVVLVSHGVMRVGWVRFWLVVVLLVLSPVITGAGLVAEPSAWGLVSLLVSLVQLGLLYAYTQTEWFAWQRTRPTGGPSLTPILAVAALVGLLGGLLGTPADANFSLSINI